MSNHILILVNWFYIMMTQLEDSFNNIMLDLIRKLLNNFFQFFIS